MDHFRDVARGDGYRLIFSEPSEDSVICQVESSE